MNYDVREIETLAEKLCEQRHGMGSWDAKHRKREAYRAAAKRIIAKGRGMVTLDALCAILGLRRAK